MQVMLPASLWPDVVRASLDRTRHLSPDGKLIDDRQRDRFNFSIDRQCDRYSFLNR